MEGRKNTEEHGHLEAFFMNDTFLEEGAIESIDHSPNHGVDITQYWILSSTCGVHLTHQGHSSQSIIVVLIIFHLFVWKAIENKARAKTMHNES